MVVRCFLLRFVAAVGLYALLFPSGASAQGTARDLDDLYARVARRAPAFGGVWVDESTNTLHVFSRNRTPAGQAAVETGLRRAFGAALPSARIEIAPGIYGFGELKAWHDRLLEVMALPGVVSVDI